MENLKNKTLGFFMNEHSSLEIWDKFGMLKREIKLYNLLAKEFKKIIIFSYGGRKDLSYSGFFEKNVEIVQKNVPLPDVIYEFLVPLVRFKKIKQCHILKTNQNAGAIAPSLVKLFFPKKKFVVRSGYIGSELAKRLKFPWYAKIYYEITQLFSYLICDQAFIPTQFNADILLKKYPFLKNKLIIMNNFVDTELFKKNPKEIKYDIIYQARLDKDKNHIAILQATKSLDLKILFIGQGKEKESLLEFSKKNNLQVEFIDKIPHNQLPNYYNQSKICVFPSLHEGNPKALLEAMSCSMAVVAFNVVGVSNIIENEKNGLLSKPDNLLLKNNTIRLLNDSSLTYKLGSEARKFIEENYSLEILLKREIDIYKKIMEK